jgi:hypothetical protein
MNKKIWIINGFNNIKTNKYIVSEMIRIDWLVLINYSN